MPITFVSATSNTIVDVSPVVNVPAGVADGDILIAYFVTNSDHNTSGTPPSGWTKIGEVDQTTDTSLSAFWRRASSEPASHTFTSIFDAPESGLSVCLAYRGCFATGDPQDVAALTGVLGNGTAWDTASITTVTDGAMVVATFGTDPASDPYTFVWDGGITERIDSDTTPSGQNGTISYQVVGDDIREVAGGGSLGGDVSVADNAIYILVALKPASGEAPPPHRMGRGAGW